MRKFLLPFVLPIALLGLAACGGGGGGGGGGTVPVAALDAEVLSVTWPAVPAGDVTLQVELRAEDGQPVNLSVERSVDGGLTWRPATLVAPVELLNLAADSAGSTHAVRWRSVKDVGFRGFAGGLLRFRPVRPGELGDAWIESVPVMDNVKAAAAGVEHYFIHYGAIDAATTRLAETYDLAIVHPFAGQVDVATVNDIQDGVDPADPGDDVLVLAYISIGEDLRTIGMSDVQMLADPRFVGDGTGPRIDPRGPDADGTSLEGLDPLGIPSNGGTGFASWYLDDNSVDQDPGDMGDGSPDRNAIFGGCFVNAGDPAWFDVLDQMTFDGVDGIPGLRELLTAGFGRGYGCDGVFLDTVDTCAPNHFTDASSFNQSEYEWTAAGFRDFTQRLRQAYPSTLILQNRGMFLFDPRHPHYAVTTRAEVDFVLLESYRLNSNTFEEFDPYFFPDNKHNLAPKVMAEANRDDGFTVLSLGYAEGPPGAMSVQTLIGQSTEGYASLVEDIYQTQDLAGFRHYLTDGGLTVANDFVRAHTDLTDVTPPVWSSTFNDNQTPFPTPPLAPTPRVGIQAVEAGPCCVTVRWDVALDKNRVGYALYYSDQPFDFDGDPTLSSATRVVLKPNASVDYGQGYGPAIYANEDVLAGLSAGTIYNLCIRAFDAYGNEEQNRVTIQATPLTPVPITIDGQFDDWQSVLVAISDPADAVDSSGPDWLNIWVTNDATNLYIRFSSENAFNLDGSPGFAFSRTLMMIDVDDDPASGYAVTASVGSELLVSGDGLYAQSAGNFNDGFITGLSAASNMAGTEVELAIPLAQVQAVDPDVSRLRLVFLNDEVYDWAPNSGALTYRIIEPTP